MRHTNSIGILLALSILVILGGAGVSFMDVDAAQYASISREMTETGSILKIYNGGREYLDKPPLLFWLSAASIWLLGANPFAYKLPSLIFACWAGWGISRLGKAWYSSKIGYFSALLWMTCQGFFLMNQDVRTDLLLTSCIVLSVWKFDSFWTRQKIQDGILAGLFTGLAMLAKGPLGLILPGLVTLTNLIRLQQLPFLLRLKAWIWLPVTALVLVPMSIGLFQQFGSEGLYFYYWKQSFGRITGENEWRNDAGPFFLPQNLIWSALPWTFGLVAGLVIFFRKMAGRFPRISLDADWLPAVGILVPLAVLSRSHYQLPHYIFVVLPFACLWTASWLVRIMENEKWRKTRLWLSGISLTFSGLAVSAALVMEFGILSSERWEFRGIWLILCGVFVFWVIKNGVGKLSVYRLMLIPAGVTIWVNGYLNFSFYPRLLEWQASQKVGEWFAAAGQSPEKLFVYRYGASHSLDFYTGKSNYVLYEPKDIQDSGARFLVTNPEGYSELIRAGIPLEAIRAYPEYRVQFLSLPFLNPGTRASQVRRLMLVKVLN